MPGVWERTLFSVSSQIYDHLCIWKFPLNSKLLGDKECLHWIWPVKKNDSFSFCLSIAMRLVFLYLIAAYASVRQCVIIICLHPQNITEISLSRKNVHRNMLSKMPEMYHNLCDNLFLLNFKKFLNIYTRILDIMKL